MNIGLTLYGNYIAHHHVSSVARNRIDREQGWKGFDKMLQAGGGGAPGSSSVIPYERVSSECQSTVGLGPSLLLSVVR